MTGDADVTIEGLQEIQAANLRAIAAMSPEGLGRAVQYMLPEIHRHLVAVTHVDTGTYRASHRMMIEENAGGDAARGSVFVDPSAVNPKTGQRPAEYGLAEEARGGEHAAYLRTITESGQDIAERGMAFLLRMLDGNS